MLFDVRAALAEILNEVAARCDTRDSCDTAPVKSQESRKSQSQPCAIAAPAEAPPSPTASAATPANREYRRNRNRNGAELAPQPAPSAPPPSREAMPYRQSLTGSPCTWTGRIVSLDEWRKLSEWERHGSTGKLWNGLTRQWEDGGAA